MRTVILNSDDFFDTAVDDKVIVKSVRIAAFAAVFKINENVDVLKRMKSRSAGNALNAATCKQFVQIDVIIDQTVYRMLFSVASLHYVDVTFYFVFIEFMVFFSAVLKDKTPFFTAVKQNIFGNKR